MICPCSLMLSSSGLLYNLIIKNSYIITSKYRVKLEIILKENLSHQFCATSCTTITWLGSLEIGRSQVNYLSITGEERKHLQYFSATVTSSAAAIVVAHFIRTFTPRSYQSCQKFLKGHWPVHNHNGLDSTHSSKPGKMDSCVISSCIMTEKI